MVAFCDLRTEDFLVGCAWRVLGRGVVFTWSRLEPFAIDLRLFSLDWHTTRAFVQTFTVAALAARAPLSIDLPALAPFGPRLLLLVRGEVLLRI